MGFVVDLGGETLDLVEFGIIDLAAFALGVGVEAFNALLAFGDGHGFGVFGLGLIGAAVQKADEFGPGNAQHGLAGIG